jgi:HEAT repeat protein
MIPAIKLTSTLRTETMHKNRQFSRWVVLLAALWLAAHASLAVADGPSESPEKENELLAVLRSDAPKAEQAITCKLLAIYGSSAAVPDLAKLLPDEQLASWARIALEAIPGPEADEALRQATASLQGRLLIGTLNSIGVRRDPLAVETLATHLQNSDAEVASAAAVALGRIGSADATRLLRESLATAPEGVRSAVAEGCVLCAERLLADGNADEAAALYDEVRAADVPKQRILEATRGAILARQQDGVPLLLEQFRSPDKSRFQLALSTAREFPGDQIDQALSDELARATPERAALLIQAMADREQTVQLASIVKAAEQGPQPVRMAAIGALGRVGDASCLATLLQVGLEPDADLAQAAKAALAELQDEAVNEQIVARLSDAQGAMYPLLIELVGQRRIDATSELLKALDHSDSAVRTAALSALGETVDLNDLPALVSQVVSPQHAADAAVAQQALKAASVRMPDREACAELLAAALNRTSSVPTKSALLETLGAMGGTKALATLAAAAKGSDPELQDVSSRLLGEWMTADAAPVLLDLAKSAPGEKYQVRALRGYIRIARQFVLPEQERAEMCRAAWEAAWQPAERKLVLDVLKRYPNAESFQVALQAMETPELKDEATQAALLIAQKLGEAGVDVGQQLAAAGLDKVKLEIVKAEYGAGAVQKDVTAVLQQRAGGLPLVTLPSPSYNASFGGDPVPGQRKQLKIQYRMDGQPGEATFAENAVIILPLPK